MFVLIVIILQFIILQVIQEYKQRKKDISVLKEDVVQREEELNKHKEEIENIKVAWLEPLQALISRINHNFSYFFRNMNCAGEVDLKVPDPPVSHIPTDKLLQIKS